MINGIYFDGSNSEKKQASLIYTEDGRVGINGIKQAIAFNMLTISSRVGNTPRHVEFPDGSQFETDDNDAIDAMVSALSESSFHGLAHRLESTLKYALLAVVIVVVFAWGFVQYGVPFLSKEIAMMLPEDASEYMGEGILETMDKYWFEPSELSPQRQQALQKIFTDLSKALDKPNAQLQFRNSEKIGANAFALPNGTIVFTDQIINISSDDNEILSIMLHEIGHLEHRHSLRAAIQNFSLAMFIMVITGDVSTSSSIIVAIPAMLVEAGYSQGMEAEADTFALEYMRANNIDPIHFANIMERLQASHSEQFRNCNKDKARSLEECIAIALEHQSQAGEKEAGISSYLSTHPATEERIQRFRE